MKFGIQRGLTLEGLRAALPKRYRTGLPLSLPSGPYTLLLFRGKVALGPIVAAALDGEPTDEMQLVAAATTFTTEAVAMLQGRGAIVVEYRPWNWSDESYLRIREWRFRNDAI